MIEPLSSDWTAWLSAKEVLKSEVGLASYQTWLDPIVPLVAQDNKLYLQAPSSFAKNHLETRYTPLLTNTLNQVTGKNWQIMYVTPEEADKVMSSVSEDASTAPARMMLNPKYTFDAFVVGNNNRFAQAASLAVAELPASAYNPLYIYGGVGLGKTHLMHAIGNFALSENPDLKIIYVSCEKFTNDLINAIRSNTTEDFRRRYRYADILMIDDVQFIAGKEQTQEELFHTFNSLHDAQKQIVLSSDKTPKEMAKLEERLRSRFEWGLVADIQPPDLETRIAILRKKAEEENLGNIGDDVMEFISTRSESNIRELEGALIRVTAFARLKGQPINMELVQEALKDLMDNDNGNRVTPNSIIGEICKRFNLSLQDIQSPRRNKEIAYPRQVGMYLIRELTDLSLSDIGNLFGGRDHSTVLYAWRSISNDVATNYDLRLTIAEIRKDLTGK